MQVQAAVLYQPGEALVVESLELAAPRQGEVLLRMGAAGVCHSDYHVMSGQAGHVLPVVLGHEGAGEIIALGEGVTDLRVGDHVVLSWIPNCGDCHFCRNDRSHLCKAYLAPRAAGTMLDESCRLSRDGAPVRHLSMLACWADHAVVPAVCCVPIRSDLPFEVAALLGCAVTTGVGAVINRAKVREQQSVAVFGTGGVGLSVIMGAELAGAGPIIAVDSAPEKEALARSFGATHFVPAGPEAVQQVFRLTDGLGAEHVFEAVGNTAVQEACFEVVRPGGQLTIVGLAGDEETMALPTARMAREEKTVTGTTLGSALGSRDFPHYGSLYAEGRLPIDRLISRRYRLEEINEACADMLSGRSGRGVIVFDGAAA